jgi:hypothetical protein
VYVHPCISFIAHDFVYRVKLVLPLVGMKAISYPFQALCTFRKEYF